MNANITANQPAASQEDLSVDTYSIAEELQTIYEQHRQGLYTLALSITGNKIRAEDAVHDAFANILKRKGTPNTSMVSYVYGSVRNAALDIHRREKTQKKLKNSIFRKQVLNNAVAPKQEEQNEWQVQSDIQLSPDTFRKRTHALFAENSPAEKAIQSDLVDQAMLAIDTLPAAQKQAIILKLYSDLSFQEIADSCGESINTVASRYRRGMQHIRQKLLQLTK